MRSSSLALLLAVSLLPACNNEEPELPRSPDQIFQEELSLPVLYISVKSENRVIAPGEKGAVVDPETGEVCWRALACHNPDCPGKGVGGEPHLFIEPDPTIVVRADGTIGPDPDAPQVKQVLGCQECMKLRDPDHETDEVRQQYIDWVRPYVLPETVQRRAELAEERKRRRAMFPDP